MTSSRRSQRGFTLVELLAVVAILGVMAAVVVVAVQSFSSEADNSACQTDSQALTQAEEVQHAQTGIYADEDTLVSAGHLRTPSTMHDIVLTSDDFTLVALGRCVEDGEVAAAVGDGATEEEADQALQQADQNLNGTGRLSTGRRINRAADDAAGLNSFGPGWTTSGEATITDGAAVLTPAKEGATGAVFFGTPVTSEGMRVTFTAASSKDSAGFAFALLDADTASESSGKGGSGLGFAGLSGYGVTVATNTEKGVPIVSIADGHDGIRQLDSTAVESVADGFHEYTVEVRSSVLIVSVDGLIVLDHEVKLPKTTRLAFTGANGEGSGSQVVAKVNIGTNRRLSDEELKKQQQQQAVLELLR